jgi:hypothetical protein
MRRPELIHEEAEGAWCRWVDGFAAGLAWNLVRSVLPARPSPDWFAMAGNRCSYPSVMDHSNGSSVRRVGGKCMESAVGLL